VVPEDGVNIAPKLIGPKMFQGLILILILTLAERFT
jgi:hypothetical protein